MDEDTIFGAPKNDVRLESFLGFFGSLAAAVSSAFRLSVDIELSGRDCRYLGVRVKP